MGGVVNRFPPHQANLRFFVAVLSTGPLLILSFFGVHYGAETGHVMAVVVRNLVVVEL